MIVSNAASTSRSACAVALNSATTAFVSTPRSAVQELAASNALARASKLSAVAVKSGNVIH